MKFIIPIFLMTFASCNSTFVAAEPLRPILDETEEEISSGGTLRNYAPPRRGLSIGRSSSAPRPTARPTAPAQATTAAPAPRAVQASPASNALSAASISHGFRATRIFSGPSQFPPKQFRAYAIIAFPSDPLTDEVARYHDICTAYRTVIPSPSEVMLPKEQQLVTVWPIDQDKLGTSATFEPDENLGCDLAVENYGDEMAYWAIKHAEIVGHDFEGHKGPFLLAWSPSASKGTSDALTLILDMSVVETQSQAKEFFQFWVRKIEEDPETWYNGFGSERLRLSLLAASENLGAGFLKLVGIK